MTSFPYFVFSPGVVSLFRFFFAWRLFISSFPLASFRYVVFSHDVFSSGVRHDETTKNATRKDEITPRKKKKNKSFKWRYFAWRYFAWRFSSFQAGFSSFRAANFVISSFGQALFRLFVVSRGVIVSLRVAFFVVSPGVISSFRRAITPYERRNGTNQPP